VAENKAETGVWGGSGCGGGVVVGRVLCLLPVP